MDRLLYWFVTRRINKKKLAIIAVLTAVILICLWCSISSNLRDSPVQQATEIDIAASTVTTQAMPRLTETTRAIPTNTPALLPTTKAITPVPTTQVIIDHSDCTLAAVFDRDVTIPDNTKIQVGQSFIKTWHIRNTGSCDWREGYRWTFIDGEQMEGPDSVVVLKTLAGESAEISVELVAPRTLGQHRGYWQMCVNETECFGDKVYVQIVSVSPPTPTPQTIMTSKGSFSLPGVAFLDGRDLEASPACTIMNINIWNSAPRQQVVCTLRHGTRIEVLEAKFDNSEDRYYFRVRSGSCEGWVSDPFLSTEYHSPVGDQIQ